MGELASFRHRYRHESSWRLLAQRRAERPGSHGLREDRWVITSIDAKEFRFSGEIITQVSHINGGRPCSRDGEFTFKITGKRKYWRMQQMDNPCDPVTDYVDIYFR
jgi:hypothetical protein